MRKTKEELVVELTEMRRELQGELDFVNSMLAVAEKGQPPKQARTRQPGRVSGEKLSLVVGAVERAGHPVLKRDLVAALAPRGVSEGILNRALGELVRSGRLVRAGNAPGKGNRPLYALPSNVESIFAGQADETR